MANGGYSVDNWIDDSASTVTVSGSADATNYPTSLLYDAAPAPRWKANAKTGVWIKVNLGSARNVKLVCLVNHNLTSGATVTLQGNATDSWGAPSYSLALTWRSPHIFLVLDQTYQWWRVTIEDASNPAYPAIGEWFLGSLTTFTTNFNFPSRGKTQRNATATGFDGSIHAVNYTATKDYQLRWDHVNTAAYAELQTMHDAIIAGVLPMLFLPDTASTEILYVKCATERLGYDEITADLDGNITLDLAEISNGVQI